MREKSTFVAIITLWWSLFYGLKGGENFYIMTTSAKLAQDGVKLRGFYRIQIVDDNGAVLGDSGYKENQVTNDGFNNYLVKTLGALSGSAQISHMALGTGGAPAASATTLSGEVSTNGSGSVVRSAVTAATSSSSKTVRFTATFSSANSFITAAANISNVGLFNVSGPTTASGTLFAGNTYTSSSCATNQNVNATYDIIFA